MKFELTEFSRNISEADFIADVKAVSITTQKDTVTIEDYAKYGKYHPSSLQRRFKSWFKVLELAELNPARSPFDISDEELFKNIALVWIKLGRQPRNKDMKQPLSLYGGNTYIRHFGTWMTALKKFIEYENSGVIEEIENEIQEDTSKPFKQFEVPDKIDNDTRTIPLRLRFSVFLRDGFRCIACGKSPMTHPGTELHCDHTLPWSKGGRTKVDNLKTLCADCNLGKGNMLEQ